MLGLCLITYNYSTSAKLQHGYNKPIFYNRSTVSGDFVNSSYFTQTSKSWIPLEITMHQQKNLFENIILKQRNGLGYAFINKPIISQFSHKNPAKKVTFINKHVYS